MPRFRRFLAKELRARLNARDKLIKDESRATPELDPRPRGRWWRTPISTLIRRSNTSHDGSNGRPGSSRSSKKNRQIRPHMIRRTDEKPRPINPSGWPSRGSVPVTQTGLVESNSTRIGEQPTDSQRAQPTQPIHSQTSHRGLGDSGAESESGSDELSEIPRYRRATRRVSDLGETSLGKFMLDKPFSFDISRSRGPTSAIKRPFCDSNPNSGVCPFPATERSTPNKVAQG